MTHHYHVRVGDQYVYCETGWDLDQLIQALTTGLGAQILLLKAGALDYPGKLVPLEVIQISLEPSARLQRSPDEISWRRIGT